MSTSDSSPRVRLSDFGLVVDDLDAYIKDEPSSYITSSVGAPSFTSHTGDTVTCAL